jgi:endonuclease YncB( thermonuclease family)
MGGGKNIALTRFFQLFGMLAGVAAWCVSPAQAQGRAGGQSSPAPSLPASSACKTEVFATGRVGTVVDGRSLVLDDGREVRLAGLEVPPFLAPGEINGQAPAAVAADRAARTTLEAIALGQKIELSSAGRQTGAKVDRYGRTLAFVHVARDGTRTSVAHEMVARGFARVSANVGDRACAVELLGKERFARERKLGLWGEAYYAVVGAENGAELVAENGRFTVAEGKVLSVRESAGTIYMNFGRRWSEALTVTVLKRNERAFAAGGLDLKKLENRRVRVRGWVEERSGPRIEATRPEQIEIAERN